MRDRSCWGGIDNDEHQPRLNATCCPFRGGIIRLRVPSSWRPAEQIRDGTVTFQGPPPESPSFHISVVAIPEQVARSSRDALSLTKFAAQGKVEDLPYDKALLAYTVSSEESGDQLATRFWHLAVKSIPSGILMAVFSFTVSARFMRDSGILEQIDFLDSEIRQGPILISMA